MTEPIPEAELVIVEGPTELEGEEVVIVDEGASIEAGHPSAESLHAV